MKDLIKRFYYVFKKKNIINDFEKKRLELNEGLSSVGLKQKVIRYFESKIFIEIDKMIRDNDNIKRYLDIIEDLTGGKKNGK